MGTLELKAVLEVSTTASQVALENLQEIVSVCKCSWTWRQSFLPESLLGHANCSLHPSTAIHPCTAQALMGGDSHLTFLALERQHWMLRVALCAPEPKGTNLGIF